MAYLPVFVKGDGLIIALIIIASIMSFVGGTTSATCNRIATLDYDYEASEGPRHIQWARLLNDNIIPGSNLTAYNTTLTEVEWGNYTCDPFYLSITDNIGLINILMAKCYGLVLSPKADVTNYFASIDMGLYGFSQINDIHNVEVGDFFTILYNMECSDNETGYVGMINAVPIKIAPNSPVETGTDQWIIALLDQVADYHDVNDSRYATVSQGIGIGLMRVYTYAGTGLIKGYTWSLESDSIYYDYTSNNTIHIGRLDTSIYPLATTITTASIASIGTSTGGNIAHGTSTTSKGDVSSISSASSNTPSSTTGDNGNIQPISSSSDKLGFEFRVHLSLSIILWVFIYML